MHSFTFCPNCKSTHISFDAFRKFECADCGMIFYQNTAAAVALIFEQDNRILFTVRNKNPEKGKLGLPGGFVDPGESLEEAARRESKEELGIEIPLPSLSYLSSHPNTYPYKDFVYKTADTFFTAPFPEVEELQLQKEEIINVRWIEKEKIVLQEIAFDSLRKGIQDYLAL